MAPVMAPFRLIKDLYRRPSAQWLSWSVDVADRQQVLQNKNWTKPILMPNSGHSDI
jgi:hypothetical protein